MLKNFKKGGGKCNIFLERATYVQKHIDIYFLYFTTCLLPTLSIFIVSSMLNKSQHSLLSLNLSILNP